MTDRTRLTCDEVRDLAPLFVTNALEPDEAAAVRDHLATCAQPHPEVAQLGAAATALLETVEPVAPPAALKDRIMAAAAADLASGAHPAARTVTPAGAPPVEEAPTPPGAPIDLASERARRRPRLAWLVAVAAVIGVVALGASNLALRRDLDQAQAYQNGVDQALALAAQPGSVSALLTAQDGTAAGFAVVGGDGTTRITMRGLPPTTGAQVYTAWSIEGEAAPVAVGDFTVGADGLATATGAAPSASPGAVIAITLEPGSGATAPTGPLVAAGTTTAPAG